MPDVVYIDSGSNTPIATDLVNIGGVNQHVQRIKLVDGTDGGTDLIAGDTTYGLDVDVTRLPSIPAGSNNIGDVDIVTMPNVTLASQANPFTSAITVDNGGTFAVQATQSGSWTIASISSAIAVSGSTIAVTGGTITVEGTEAEDDVATSNPVRLGATAATGMSTAVSNGDLVSIKSTTDGKIITYPFAPSEVTLASGVNMTDAASTAVFAAQGAGVTTYVTDVMVTNAHASVGTVVKLLAGTNVVWYGYAAANGGGFSHSFSVPLNCGANTAVNAQAVTSGADIYVSVGAFTSHS